MIARGARVAHRCSGIDPPDASVAAKPILEYAPSNAAAEAYLQLARELMLRGTVA